jgi:hypothetical protein
MPCIVRIILAALLVLSPSGPVDARNLTFACRPDNDLYKSLPQTAGIRRFNDPLLAIEAARRGTAVLLLADDYPHRRTEIPAEASKHAQTKQLRLYVEFPMEIEGIDFGPIRTSIWERAVIARDALGSRLSKLKILAVHDCHFLPVRASNAWLALGRVAGYDTALYGIPEQAHALLFEIPERNLLIATTKLSDFAKARFAPSAAWEQLWIEILNHLDPQTVPHRLAWTPSVAPSYGPEEELPRDYEAKAFRRAAEWIHQSGLLVPASAVEEIRSALLAGKETRPVDSNASEAPADGAFGMLEGYASGIRYTGRQDQRLPLRADCIAESAMVLALDAAFNRNRRSRQAATNLLDYVYFRSDICSDERADPDHGAFGLIGWGAIAPAWKVANYGDDNARALLGTIVAMAALKNERWSEPVAKAILANFRTTGKRGFRGDRIDVPQLAQHGWKHFHNAGSVNYSPHFESYLWACYLWAYRQTGYEPFLERTRTGIRLMMEAYPDGWRWQDNMERARMLLCLSWLIRIEDAPEHRQWLHRVADDLLKRQQANGAIHEWLAGTGGGHYQIPQSNEAYGTAETPLIQQNGDPASDQLYTTGFALLALHEAAGATGEEKFRRAADRLAEFLCRIQIRSQAIAHLDGAWFRAFDDQLWDYWASSADVGWGAWCVEAGWGQAWTAGILGLRQSGAGDLWTFISRVNIKDDFQRWKPAMLPE